MKPNEKKKVVAGQKKAAGAAAKKVNASRGGACQLEAAEGWRVVRKAVSAGVATGRRRSGVGDAEVPVLPDFMGTDQFEVLDVVEMEPESGPRRKATGSEATLKATVPADASVILVIRQGSGAISFRRPSGDVRRGAAGGKALTVEVQFAVPVLPGDPQNRRRGLVSFVTAALVKIVKKAVDLVVDPIAQLAVPFLATKLEERLWKGRHQGWMHVTQSTLAAKKLAQKVPDFSEGQRGLLFIHGTFSNAGSAFTELAQGPFFDALHTMYGDNIYAFDHFTFSKTLEENVADLFAELPARAFNFDVITHSRGGLVLRAMTEATSTPGKARIKFGRVVLVASPNGGTPLVTPQHWDDKLSWLANILEMFPVNPFTTAAEWLTNALSWFADKVVGNAPGLMTMDMQGVVIGDLQQGGGAPSGSAYYALAANYYAPQKWWSRLADMGVDSFFGGANDLVVPTEGGWQVDVDPAFWIPAERIGCFGLQGNIAPDEPSAVNHITFFARRETADFILQALRGDTLGLPTLTTLQAMPTRRGAKVTGAVMEPMHTLPRGSGAGFVAELVPKITLPAEFVVKPKHFGDEDVLTLTVITHAAHSDIGTDDTVPLLLATYAGARVAIPFYTRGDSVGQRWHVIITMQRFMVAYANGKGTSFKLKNGDVIDNPTDAFLEEFGQVLFETLFPGEVRRLYDAARFRHDKRRLNIIFTSMIPWVADFPWEFAFDKASETFLATGDVRLVRNVLTLIPEDRFTDSANRLRILVVSALPSGSVPVSIDEERQGIERSFKPLIDAGLVHVEVIPRATPTLLHRELRERLDGEEYDIVHFIGHGEYDSRSQTGYLIFEDEDHSSLRLSASELLDILRSRGIRIVFLNACETGRGEGADYNRGVAMALVRDGIPAVVANQYSVLDRAASLFSLHFYTCLAYGKSIGDAMREARIAIRYSAMEPMDWGVPVLFARNPNATLCEPIKRTQPSPSSPGLALRASAVAGEGGPPPPDDTSRSRRSPILSSAESGNSQMAGRLKVSVWDVANALPYREKLDNTIAEMNAAQDQFFFRLEKMTAPRGMWKVDRTRKDNVAYLQTEEVAPRMEELRMKLGVNFLFCITDLPLEDSETIGLYLSGDEHTTIMSIWPFEPPLTGRILKAAFANCMVASLAVALSGVAPDNEPKHSVGYFNAEIDVAHVAGKQSFTKDNLQRMRKMGRITEAQIKSMQVLLVLFQPSGVEDVYPEVTMAVKVKKRQARRRRR